MHMKNKTKIFALLIALVLLPSCMVNKCRYSSGWKIDLSGNRGSKNTSIIEKKAESAVKKSNQAGQTPEILNCDSAIAISPDLKDSVTQTVVIQERQSKHQSTRVIRKQLKSVTPSILKQENQKYTSLSALKNIKQTKKTANIFEEIYNIFIVICYIILGALVALAIYLLIVEPLAFLVLLGLIGLILLSSASGTPILF